MMYLVEFITAMLAISCTGHTGVMTTNSSPGLKFEPKPDPADPDNTFIYYKLHDEASLRKWTSKLDELLQEYRGVNATGLENKMYCSPNSLPSGKLYCDVAPQDFGPCVPEKQYNYHRAAPCVFLKLDKLLNWTPDPYTTSADLPTDMPEGLKQHINNVSDGDEANTVWVSCEGENPADVEFIGPIQYFPKRGFPTYYFPYANQEGYLSPLVAVHFERPRMEIVINIECKAWAKNIVHDKYQQRGSVHFELMVDS